MPVRVAVVLLFSFENRSIDVYVILVEELDKTLIVLWHFV